MPKGTVKRLFADRGFGFIKPDEGGKDVWFHARSVAQDGFNQLAEGDSVEYRERSGDRGPQATQVRLLAIGSNTSSSQRRRASYRFLNPYNFVRLMKPLASEDGPGDNGKDQPATTMAAALRDAGSLNLPVAAPSADLVLLDRCPPPPHDRYVGITGKITCTLENTSPLFISNSEGVAQHGVHPSYEFFKYDGQPAIPASSLRGMLRSVFEAATNSCMSIMASETRLSHHVPPSDALKLVPARVVHENESWSLQLLTGATEFRPGQRPQGPQYAAWVPMYLNDMIRPSRNAQSPAAYGKRRAIARGQWAHGQRCWARLKQIEHPRRNFEFWNVEELAESQDQLTGPQGPDECLAQGYLCINNQNIENKHDERFFFVQGGLARAQTIALGPEVRGAYRILIEDYQHRHRDHVQKYRKKYGDPEQPAREEREAAYSRFIVDEKAQQLQDGDLVYAMIDEHNGVRTVEYIVPVSVPRVAYEKSVGEVLAEHDHHHKACDEGEKLCPACRVFGWVMADADAKKVPKNKPVSYAGRVRFSHASCLKTAGTLPPTPLAILSSPKPTTTKFYLHPKSGKLPPKWEARNGYDGEVRLRGRKFYRHHGTAKETEYRRAGNKTDDQNRTVRDALLPGARFEFTIDFENLALIELGALLWTLEMDQHGVHRLGFAKPLGFGSVQIRIRDMMVLDTQQRYTSLREPGWHAITQWQTICVAPFKTAMENHYGKPFDNLPAIEDLKAILSDPPDGLPVHYPRMSQQADLNGKSFEWFMGNNRQRQLPLPPVTEDTGLPLILRDGTLLD